MTFKSLLNSKVDIKRASYTINDLGEREETWSTIYTNVACRLSPISDELMLLSRGEYENIQYKGYFLPTTDIQNGDIIVYNNEDFFVREVKKDSMSHHLEVLLQKIYND